MASPKLKAPLAALCGSAFLLLVGCSSSSESGDNPDGSATDGGPGGGQSSNGGASSNGGNTSGGGFAGSALQGVDAAIVARLCSGGGCTCSDGIDNDKDGLIDGFDPECTGPFDNDESSFATGIPGDNKDPKWQDCFFDGNSGGGDDGCRYSTDCLTGGLPPTDKDCKLSQQCIDYCKPLVSNGCDCFGCCTVQTPGGPKNILIGTDCSLDKIDDAKACPVCTKSPSCQNDCGTCELCPGKTEADLPSTCKPPPVTTDAGTSTPPPPSYTCDTGQQVCSPTIACPDKYYCQLGCCHIIVR